MSFGNLIGGDIILVIKDLTLYLKNDLRTILKDFSLSVDRDDKIALIGEEGNGKSSILKAIYNEELLKEYMEVEGEVYKEDEVIGYLPQTIDDSLVEMTTEDYLYTNIDLNFFDYNLYYRLVDDMDFPEDKISKKIKLKELSGGEKIKIQLLVEMLKEPTLLLLDEPSNDLDLKSVEWLENFINSLKIPILFISHDEELLEACANKIIHLEQLMRKSKPVYTIKKLGYVDYIEDRALNIFTQTKDYNKDKEEYNKKMEKYQKVYERVQHELRSVSRGAPSVAKNLKDKMHSVKSMGRRFESEKENLTERPDYEESIFLSFKDDIYIPNNKEIISLKLDELSIGDRILSRDIYLNITGPKKICIVGDNGRGKTSLLNRLLDEINPDLSVGYMPQDYSLMMDGEKNAIDFLTESSSKDEITKVRTYLGSLNFKSDEMLHKTSNLSGGQRAKLYFAKMILDKKQVLVLDEPTRNLSVLSGPEIRQALIDFKGSIISVSHDRRFIEEVIDELYELREDGLFLL